MRHGRNNIFHVAKFHILFQVFRRRFELISGHICETKICCFVGGKKKLERERERELQHLVVSFLGFFHRILIK